MSTWIDHRMPVYILFIILCHMCVYIWQYWVLNLGSQIWIQGLVFDRKAHYHLSHAPNPYCFILFWIGSCILCLGLASDCCSPTSISYLPGITNMYLHVYPCISFSTLFLNLSVKLFPEDSNTDTDEVKQMISVSVHCPSHWGST
jgi:hypothetical protein